MGKGGGMAYRENKKMVVAIKKKNRDYYQTLHNSYKDFSTTVEMTVLFYRNLYLIEILPIC